MASSFVRRSTFFAATLAALALAPRSARASDPGPDALPIQVLTILPDGGDDQADALTKALRSAVRRSDGWSLGLGDNSLEVLALQLKCAEPPDGACAALIGDQLKADRVVWGTLRVDKGQTHATVHMWTRGKGDSVRNLEYSDNLTSGEDDALIAIAKKTLDDLTGGAPRGAIAVKAPGIVGEVLVDGVKVGDLKGGEGTFPVPSGARKITVHSAGYSDAQTTVKVTPNGTTNVTLNPQKIEAGIDWQLIGAYASIGVGVVGAGLGFGGMGIVAGAQGSEDFQNARKNPEIAGAGKMDVCSAIEVVDNGPARYKSAYDSCKNGSTGELLQIVGFPMAGIFGGLGAALLLTRKTGPSDGAPKTAITPTIGPNAGGVTVTFHY